MKPLLRNLISMGLAAMLVCPSAKAQSGFFITTDASSGNVWTNMCLNLFSSGINALFPSHVYYDIDDQSYQTGVLGSQAYDDYLILRENGKWMKLPDRWRSVFGFRALDLFSQLKANIKVGWMGAYSPIGVYARAGIRHNNFLMQLAADPEATRYMVTTFCPGFGVRVAPGNFLDLDLDPQPFVEFGTNYNKTIHYEGPFDNDKTVLNEGLSYMLSGGLQYSKRVSIQLGVEWFPSGIFNKEYIAPDSTTPYANLTSKMFSIFVGVNRGF